VSESGKGPEPDSGLTTNQITERIVREIKPYLVPNKVGEATQHIGAMVVEELYEEFHQGPLPAPRQLTAYEQTLPGAAERIMTMAESEQSHRHGSERLIIRSEIVLKFIGQSLAFLSLVAMLALLAYMVREGYPQQAAALGAVMLTGVVGLFLAPKFFHRPVKAPPPKPPAKASGRRKR